MTHDPLCPNIKHPDGCLCCEISAPCIYCDLIAKVREDAIAAAVQRVEALPWEVAVSFGPIDCNYSCDDGPCTCSGEMRPTAWTTGPAAVIAAIKGDQP